MRTFLATSKDNLPIMGVPKGTLAIYKSGPAGDDDTPAIAPLGNLDKLAFHSALDYLGVVEDLTTQITFPAGNFTSATATTRTLYAHGAGAKPLAVTLMSTDGVNWGALNGTVFTLLGNIFLGRSLVIQADETNFYLRSNELGNLIAQTLHFRTLVLSRTFGTGKVKTNETFFASPAAVRANGGLFDTTRRYLQSPGAGQTALFAHKSGQTFTAIDGDEEGELDIEVHNVWNFQAIVNAVASNGAPLYTPPVSDFGQPLLENEFVLEGPAAIPDTLELSPARMRIGDGSGSDVFDTARKTLAVLAEFNGSFSTAAHAAVPSISEVPHEIVHASVALPIAPGGLTPMAILGWLEITSAPAGVIVLSNKPSDLSGSILVYATAATEALGSVWIQGYSTISARIVGTTLQIVESWFNNVIGSNSTVLPAFTFNAHVFACGLLGGF